MKIHIEGPVREQILRVMPAPSFVGIPTSYGDKINHYSATTVMDSTVCYIHSGIFKDFIYSNGRFAFEIIVELCKGELFNYKKCINKMQKRGPGKIAEALLYFSQTIFKSDSFKLPLSRYEMGDLSCTSRETVSRMLTDFEKNKIIKVDKRNISILNVKQLETISEMG